MIVGWLKAVLATSAAFWALLWVHVFAPLEATGSGRGLRAFLAVSSLATLGASLGALPSLRVLHTSTAADHMNRHSVSAAEHTFNDRAPFGKADRCRLTVGLAYTLALAFFCVVVAYLFSEAIGGLLEIGGLLGLGGFGRNNYNYNRSIGQRKYTECDRSARRASGVPRATTMHESIVITAQPPEL